MNKLPLIEKSSYPGLKFRARGKSDFSAYSFLLWAVIFIFLILVLRLFQLTVVKGEYYARLSEENRIREIVIEPQRGKIVDRNGIALAQNTPANPDQTGNRYFSPRTYTEPE